MRATMHFDGACKGNPGPAAGAAVLYFDNVIPRHPVPHHGERFVGTNNEAEWKGLLVGIHAALKAGVKHLTIHGDSKLVVEAVAGRWKCKAPNLKPFHGEAMALLQNFEHWEIHWIPREQNRQADHASNVALRQPRRLVA